MGVRIKGLKLRRNSDWTGNQSGAPPGPRPPLPRRGSRGCRGTQIRLTRLCTPPRVLWRRSSRAPENKFPEEILN